jgi:NAD(P)-dependent dehydrogenase (short-subunit alcohol dehydrogenase family)
MNLSGKNVVVTGAAGGIGAALARKFHAAGAHVVCADRDSARIHKAVDDLIAHSPHEKDRPAAHAVVADISTEQGNVDLIRQARSMLDSIDLFFANAGVGMGALLENTDEDTWETVMNINFHSHRWAAKHLLEEWIDRKDGYFCSTASAAGLLSQIGSATYSVSKHAAVAFAEWLAITYGDQGIKVSCLCPQGVNTDMLNPPSGTESLDTRGLEAVKASGNVLEPDEVANIVYQHVLDEKFLILPHAEVATYEERKVADRDRWISGMQRLQSRILNG